MRALVLLLALTAPAAAQDQWADVRAAIMAYGCGTCHVIPDVPGANGVTGPPLTRMREQAYVAGVLPNMPEALTSFIVDPQAIDPRSAMPDLGVTADEAARMAAFLIEVSGE
ncbi:c-type cytochrome [Tranquillimonas alkanivorans]|uniref:Cytochrome c domain-containing protein n=1 Tax=Tranquillimonas alkanivorans TaxID=441119 RepID=A0A1I5VLQ3_9RHOB|nr:hypothetical protein [Tranquillimonas alkanivorans]SFQ08383.1 hypothetical protein SAMN04488047_1332 [Tranquillimonas alkanivorans]